MNALFAGFVMSEYTIRTMIKCLCRDGFPLAHSIMVTYPDMVLPEAIYHYGRTSIYIFLF
jgi:hypothetical protein